MASTARAFEHLCLVQQVFTDEQVEFIGSEDGDVMRLVIDALKDPNARAKCLTLFASQRLSLQTCQALGDAFRANTVLDTVFIGGPSQYMDILLAGVGNSRSIQKLGLLDCGSAHQQDITHHLVAAIRLNARLESLSIINCESFGGTTALANALSDGSCRLTRLQLHACGVNSIQAAEIASMLEENTTLEVLCLTQNPIGNDGAAALGRALSGGRNTVLMELFLCGCDVGNAGAVALADLLKKTNTLGALYLRSNQKIAVEGKQALMDGLSCNLSLCLLGLDTPVNQELMDLSLTMNRFRKKALSQNCSTITPALWPHVFARVSDKPCALFLFLQENRDMLVANFPESTSGRATMRKRKASWSR
jgi:hypothetical protein